MKILFFISSLRAGGKERRLIELLSYLKVQGKYDIKLILASEHIHYQAFFDLGIDYISLNKKPKDKDPKIFFKLYKICKLFKPDIIHTWGEMETFYMLPAAKITKTTIINSQITSAPPQMPTYSFLAFQNFINFMFADVILANSFAGLKAYAVEKRKNTRVIYNGISLNRFENITDKENVKAKFGIKTPIAVVMTASYTPNKDYDTFLQIAEIITSIRNDVSFIIVGNTESREKEFEQLKNRYKNNHQIILPGLISDVEALVNACDIGILFSPNGEGFSNSILEYMAIGKPVIANDAGGNKELITQDENGYLLPLNERQAITEKIIFLIDNPEIRRKLGKNNQQKIAGQFTVEKMGKRFEDIYSESVHK